LIFKHGVGQEFMALFDPCSQSHLVRKQFSGCR